MWSSRVALTGCRRQRCERTGPKTGHRAQPERGVQISENGGTGKFVGPRQARHPIRRQRVVQEDVEADGEGRAETQEVGPLVAEGAPGGVEVRRLERQRHGDSPCMLTRLGPGEGRAGGAQVGFITVGGMTVNSWSSTQRSIAMSSGESGFNALVWGVARAVCVGGAGGRAGNMLSGRP